MKRLGFILLAFVFLIGMTGTAMATNGYQLIGVGQNQKSMGGAVTAAPMDAMTAISNPAGMARIGSRADFSIEAFMPKRSVDFDELGGDDESGGSELYGIPAIGWTAPAFNRDDVYFGGGMYGTSGLGVDYGQVDMMPGAVLDMMAGAPPGTFSDVTFDGYSAIQFWKMAPTVAWNVNKQLAVGLALNLDYQSVAIRERIRNVPFWNDPTNQAAGITQMDVNLDLGRPTSQLGYGATIGAIYDINDMVALGFSYSTQQNFGDAEFRVGEGDVYNFNGAVGKAGTYKMDLDYPQQAALGVAVKPIDNLLVAADVKWINWSATHDKVDFEGPSDSFDGDGNPMNGGEKSSTELDFGWEDQWVYALGLQYQATKQLAVRAGYNYSKAPIDEEDVFNNLVFPAVVVQHYTIGADYRLGDHWGVGLTYMKAVKETVKGKDDVSKDFQYVTPFESDSDIEMSLEEDSVGVQLSYLF
jgi:long-chain fatty acid transport protein